MLEILVFSRINDLRYIKFERNSRHTYAGRSVLCSNQATESTVRDAFARQYRTWQEPAH